MRKRGLRKILQEINKNFNGEEKVENQVFPPLEGDQSTILKKFIKVPTVGSDQSYNSLDNDQEDILPPFRPARHPGLHLPNVITRKDHQKYLHLRFLGRSRRPTLIENGRLLTNAEQNMLEGSEQSNAANLNLSETQTEDGDDMHHDGRMRAPIQHHLAQPPEQAQDASVSQQPLQQQRILDTSSSSPTAGDLNMTHEEHTESISAQSSFVDSGLSDIQPHENYIFQRNRQHAPLRQNGITTLGAATNNATHNQRRIVIRQEEGNIITGIRVANPPFSIPTDVHIHNDGDYRIYRNVARAMCVDIQEGKRQSELLSSSMAYLHKCATCFQRPRQTVNWPCMCMCNCLECDQVMVACAVCQCRIESSVECRLQ